MSVHSSVLLRCVFPALVLFSLLDRVLLVDRFGFHYLSEDDAVVQLAAHDYAHGDFREPCFYGQDYNPLLESFLAAPFVALGGKPWLVLPIVTSLLALLPFWSFGFWHYRRGNQAASALFAAMPLLLPVEYGMMTTISRGFVSGIGVLALVPWTLGPRSLVWRCGLTALVLSAAGWFNPNSTVFSAAAVAAMIISAPQRLRASVWCLIGAMPFLIIQYTTTAWYRVRPGYAIYSIQDWRMDFHPEAIPEGIANLALHFKWLFPLAWEQGWIAAPIMLMMIAIHFRERSWPTALGLCAAMALITFSFSFGKVHDGEPSVFYPAPRMFLAVPLLLCWALSQWDRAMMPRWLPGAVFASGVACFGIKCGRMADVIHEQLENQPGQVAEAALDDLRTDADLLLGLCDRHAVKAIVMLCSADRSRQLHRAYFYPLLHERLPPSRAYSSDRRHWQRMWASSPVLGNVLITGGDQGRWGQLMASDPTILDVSESGTGPLHILWRNTQSLDSVADRFGELR